MRAAPVAVLLAATVALADPAAVRQKIERLQSFFDPTSRTHAGTKHLYLETDFRTGDAATTTAVRIESGIAAVRELTGLPVEEGEGPRAYVCAYRLRDSYFLARDALGGPGDEDGFVSEDGIVAFHLDPGGAEDPRRTSIREGVRWYVRSYVFPDTVSPPPWIEEGLARHVSAAPLTGTKIVPQLYERDPNKVRRLPPWPGAPEPPPDPKPLRKRLKAGKGFSLTELVEAGTFPDDMGARRTFDAESRFFLEYILYGIEGKDVSAFHDLMARVAAGEPSENAIATVYGKKPAEMQESWEKFLGKID